MHWFTITFNVGANTLPIALSNFEDCPSGPELRLKFLYNFRSFVRVSMFVYEKVKARWNLGRRNDENCSLFEVSIESKSSAPKFMK